MNTERAWAWAALRWSLALTVALPACERAALGASVIGAFETPVTMAFPAPDSLQPFWLSETGLYREISSKTLAADLIAYQPEYALWSDGSDKQRWLRLPAGTVIDTTDMDHWTFPIGSVLFKEFSREGVRLETRVLARVGPGPEDYFMGAFQWQEDERDAQWVPLGATGVRGTDHAIPSGRNCLTCHNGEPGRVLGFSALQQPNVDAQLLSAQPLRPHRPPGDATTRLALGYLHANCGHCHNPDGAARPDTDLSLRLEVTQQSLEATHTYHSTVNQPLQALTNVEERVRIVPGAPEKSGLWLRMTQRGTRAQMPPLGTQQVDAAGVERVRAFIVGLSERE